MVNKKLFTAERWRADIEKRVALALHDVFCPGAKKCKARNCKDFKQAAIAAVDVYMNGNGD